MVRAESLRAAEGVPVPLPEGMFLSELFTAPRWSAGRALLISARVSWMVAEDSSPEMEQMSLIHSRASW